MYAEPQLRHYLEVLGALLQLKVDSSVLGSFNVVKETVKDSLVSVTPLQKLIAKQMEEAWCVERAVDYLYNIIGDDEDEILADVQECLKDLKSLGGEVWRPLLATASFRCRLGNRFFLQSFLMMQDDKKAALRLYSCDGFCSAFSANEQFRKIFYAMMKDDKKAALRLYSCDGFCSAFSANEQFRKIFYAMMKDDKKAALRLYSCDGFCSAFSANEQFRKIFYAMMKDDKKAALRLYSCDGFCSAFWCSQIF
eukprot:g8090.t1